MMQVFVDTSALYAVLDADDQGHEPAKDTWRELLDGETTLLTTNYVLVETSALLQNRLGLDAVRVFHQDVLPALVVVWVDETLHRAAARRGFYNGGRGGIPPWP